MEKLLPSFEEFLNEGVGSMTGKMFVKSLYKSTGRLIWKMTKSRLKYQARVRRRKLMAKILAQEITGHQSEIDKLQARMKATGDKKRTKNMEEGIKSHTNKIAKKRAKYARDKIGLDAEIERNKNELDALKRKIDAEKEKNKK